MPWPGVVRLANLSISTKNSNEKAHNSHETTEVVVWPRVGYCDEIIIYGMNKLLTSYRGFRLRLGGGAKFRVLI